jgi:hypothetical protein
MQTSRQYRHLIDEFAVERNADRGQQETSVLVGCCGGVDDDVATGDHLRWVPGGLLECCAKASWYPEDLHVVVHLNLREGCNLLRGETKGDVAGGIARASLDTSPFLHLGHDNIHTFAQEVVHILAL